MAWLDILKSGGAKGFLAGVAVAGIAPVVAPKLAAGARPLARTLLKSGIVGYEKGREMAAEAAEAFDDLVAEVRHELAEEAGAASEEAVAAHDEQARE